MLSGKEITRLSKLLSFVLRHAHYRADNGVWLVEEVPARYLQLPDDAASG